MDCTNNKWNYAQMINTRKMDKIIDKKLMQKVSKVMKNETILFIYTLMHNLEKM
jgi:hypothetical protein